MTPRGKRRIASWGSNFHSQSKYSATSSFKVDYSGPCIPHFIAFPPLIPPSRRIMSVAMGMPRVMWYPWGKVRKDTKHCRISRLASLFPHMPVSFDYNILRQYSYCLSRLGFNSPGRCYFLLQIHGVNDARVLSGVPHFVVSVATAMVTG